MKAKLLFIFMLLFTIPFFGQGFSGFRIHNAGTKEIIQTTTSVTTKTDSIASKNGDPAEKIITTETVSNSLKKEVPITYLNETLVTFPWNSDKVTNLFTTLYGEANFLNQAGVTFGNNSGAIYTEIAGGRFLRNFRLSLGAMVSSTSGGTQEQERAADAYQRLVSYGGNTVLNIEYPWLYKYSKDWNVHVLSRFFFKGTADIPALGTTTEDWAGSCSLGVNFYADAATISIESTKPGEEIKLFFDGNFSYIVGTDVYKENLGIKNNNFTFAQLTAGFVYKSLKVSVIFATLSSESALRKNKAVIGVQGIK
jgi:hypothetical protein